MPIPVLTFPPMGIDKILTLSAENQSHWRPISLALGQSDFPIQEYVDLTLEACEVEKVLGSGDIGGQISLRSKISILCLNFRGGYPSGTDIDNGWVGETVFPTGTAQSLLL